MEELLLVAVYLLVVDESGNCLRNLASDDFNRSKVEMKFISLGRRFYRRVLHVVSSRPGNVQ